MHLKALVFDVDGTLADTEELHRQAFNSAFETAGLPWHWTHDDYINLLLVPGGKERIEHFALTTGHAGGLDIPDIHAEKTRIYEGLVDAGQLQLRPGVHALIRRAQVAGLRLAIATTTSRPNVDALLRNTLGEMENPFEVMVCGNDVKRKKPDPEVYQLTLEKLDLKASCCVAFEDSHAGLLAAKAAGLLTVVTPNLYTSHHDFAGADHIISDFDHPLSGPEMNSPTSMTQLPKALHTLLMGP